VLKDAGIEGQSILTVAESTEDRGGLGVEYKNVDDKGSEASFSKKGAEGGTRIIDRDHKGGNRPSDENPSHGGEGERPIHELPTGLSKR